MGQKMYSSRAIFDCDNNASDVLCNVIVPQPSFLALALHSSDCLWWRPIPCEGRAVLIDAIAALCLRQTARRRAAIKPLGTTCWSCCPRVSSVHGEPSCEAPCYRPDIPVAQTISRNTQAASCNSLCFLF